MHNKKHFSPHTLKGAKSMSTIQKSKDRTQKQICAAKQLIEILKTIPEEKQSLFAVIVIAYIDGLKNGARIDAKIR